MMKILNHIFDGFIGPAAIFFYIVYSFWIWRANVFVKKAQSVGDIGWWLNCPLAIWVSFTILPLPNYIWLLIRDFGDEDTTFSLAFAIGWLFFGATHFGLAPKFVIDRYVIYLNRFGFFGMGLASGNKSTWVSSPVVHPIFYRADDGSGTGKKLFKLILSMLTSKSAQHEAARSASLVTASR